MSIAVISLTNTFRDWFNKTNEIIAKMNSGALVDGVVANGAFSVNGSLLVVNTFSANSTKVDLRGNTTFTANVVITSNCNVWNFACGTLLIQPINGTVVNSAISINGAATFLQPITANANVFITADLTQTGNVLVTGTMVANGALVTRQTLYGAAGALAVPAALSNPQYDDYVPTGGDAAEVWNLSPGIDTVLTGLAAPAGITVGARLLYIQNLSATYKVSFASANTSSQTNNQFKTPGDTQVDISPGSAVGVIWSSTNHQWRVLSPPASGSASFINGVFSGFVNVATTLQVTGNSQLGNTNVTGWLNVSSTLAVAGLTTLTGNVTMAGFVNVAGLSTHTGNATFGGFVNVAGLSTHTGNATFGGFANIASTLQVTGIATLSANVIVNGSRLFANGQVRCDTTAGRLVLPVGTNLWAT